MSWTRGLLAALAICALLGGSAGCGTGDAHGRGGEVPASPVGKVLDDTDEEGRHYREIDEKGAPGVGIEVQPNTDDSWDVRLTVRRFRFSPAGTRAVAVAGRGSAVLLLDGRILTRLRTPAYRLSGDLVPRGTHHLTARLYADDRTVWAVDGVPVECTADITASGPAPAPTADGGASVPRSRPTAAADGGTGAGVPATKGGHTGARRPR
ncbi:nuclear transport factor 2 family protein [Streptomyces sp. NPDC005907]|uniref:nuclear transport factor 2 family protein n=1 Tax=Streptomyces sp. NPDC005907 TaxID=3154571 RepID=UPI0033F57221